MEQQFITIKQAATLLGVSPLTLRNWDKRGQLVAYRHPVNNYRVYKVDEIEEFLQKIEKKPQRQSTGTQGPKKLKINFIEEA